MLPEKFMLPADRIPDCRDQGKNEICIAMAITAVFQVLYRIKTGEWKQFSPSWGAAVWRSDVDAQKNMKGLTLKSAIPKSIEIGAVLTDDFPDLCQNPEAYEYVKTHPELWDKCIKLIDGFEEVKGSKAEKIEAIKEALIKYQIPIVAAVKDKPDDHCVPVIGWDNGKGVIKVMNSFGDRGGAMGHDSYKYEDLRKAYILIPIEEEESTMGNSPLVDYIKISPNKSLRKAETDTITIHCVVGQLTVEAIGNCFDEEGEACSANYGIGFDGKIGLYVPENYRSWCSSNAANDHRAITIEVACEPKHPYEVTQEAYRALIKLLVDICKRNNIKQLLWKGDKSLIGQVDKQNMTVHRWFANKACPGDWLYERHGQIAEEVNRLLSGDKFTDIKDHYGRAAINEIAEKGIINGRGDGTYAPNEFITRGDLAIVISNVLKHTKSE